MIPERYINAAVLLGLIALPLWALQADEIFTITLTTRAVILALAAVGLNIALGIGGMVSFGHAAFFGLGGYAMGILAFHAQSFTPMDFGAFTLPGTKSMPVIWLVAATISALAAWLIGLLSLRTTGVYFIMITLAFGQMFFYFAISWGSYGGEDGLSIYVRNGFPGLNTLIPIQFFALCLAAFSASPFSSNGACAPPPSVLPSTPPARHLKGSKPSPSTPAASNSQPLSSPARSPALQARSLPTSTASSRRRCSAGSFRAS